jgi:surface polysaccharide O-acyltransferase-like enzyme
MSLETARNIAIVVLLALVVWLVPGGGDGADFVQQALGAIFIVLIVLFAMRLYRQFQGDIFALGDPWRFTLYAAVGVAVVTVAARPRLWTSGAGKLAFFALLAAASYALYVVWQRYRSYA